MEQASWIAEILLAAMLTAIVAFGLHISNKMERLSERVSNNGERIAGLSERVANNGKLIARLEERVSLNSESIARNGESIARLGESIARIEALLTRSRADATPPAQQKSAQRR